MSNKDAKIFSKNLKYYMKLNHKEQVDIIADLGINKSTISTWVRGEKLPRMSKIQLLANYFNINISDLVDDNENKETSNIIAIDQHLYNTPVFESVSAGFGAMAVDSVVDYIPLPYNSKAEADETICIKVSGDSMSPKIEDGDIIQVRKQSSVDSGDIAVVLINETDGLVKKVEYGTDYIKLISINPYYPPIEFKGSDVLQVMFVGKVKKIIREL